MNIMLQRPRERQRVMVNIIWLELELGRNNMNLNFLEHYYFLPVKNHWANKKSKILWEILIFKKIENEKLKNPSALNFQA